MRYMPFMIAALALGACTPEEAPTQPELTPAQVAMEECQDLHPLDRDLVAECMLERGFGTDAEVEVR